MKPYVKSRSLVVPPRDDLIHKLYYVFRPALNMKADFFYVIDKKCIMEPKLDRRRIDRESESGRVGKKDSGQE